MIYRAAVALFYMDGCPYKDIATILEILIGTAKSRVSRGVERLRKILLSEGIGESAAGAKKSSFGLGVDTCQTRQEPEILGRGYDEWDFGSTLLLERPGMA
jgi:hypothetical protein